MSDLLEPYEEACRHLSASDRRNCYDCRGSEKRLTKQGETLIKFIMDRIYTPDGSHLIDYEPFYD